MYGYFAMPLLAGGRLRRPRRPAREGTTLVAKQVSLDDAEARSRPMAQALREAATWVGCDAVAGRAAPSSAAEAAAVASELA